MLVGQPREIKPRSTLRSRRELYKEYKADWEAFPDLRGTHVRRKPVRSGGYDLVTQDGLVLGRIFEGRARAHTLGLHKVVAGGRTYRSERIGKAREDSFKLVDIAANPDPVLWVNGRHWAGRRASVVHLPGDRWFRFPVRGTNPGSSVMTAVNESGQNVAHFRRERSRSGSRAYLLQHRIEVVVNPAHQVTTELVLVIAVASGFVSTWYAAQPGGGGG